MLAKTKEPNAHRPLGKRAIDERNTIHAKLQLRMASGATTARNYRRIQFIPANTTAVPKDSWSEPSLLDAFRAASISATDPPIHTARLTPLRIERASRRPSRACEGSWVRSRARMVISLWVLESVTPSWPPSISQPPHAELARHGQQEMASATGQAPATLTVTQDQVSPRQ